MGLNLRIFKVIKLKRSVLELNLLVTDHALVVFAHDYLLLQLLFHADSVVDVSRVALEVHDLIRWLEVLKAERTGLAHDLLVGLLVGKWLERVELVLEAVVDINLLLVGLEVGLCLEQDDKAKDH